MPACGHSAPSLLALLLGRWRRGCPCLLRSTLRPRLPQEPGQVERQGGDVDGLRVKRGAGGFSDACLSRVLDPAGDS